MVLKNTIFTVSSENGFGTRLSKLCAESISGDSQLIVNLNEISNNSIEEIQDLIEYSDRFIFVMPEFNGSFPAAFKQVIDNSGWPSKFKDKPIFLIGYSGGFSGNIVGINQMKTILSYIKSDLNRDYACFTYNGKLDLTFQKEKDVLIEHIREWDNKTKEL